MADPTRGRAGDRKEIHPGISPISPDSAATATINPMQRYSSGPSPEELAYATLPGIHEEEDLGTYGGDRASRAFGAQRPATAQANISHVGASVMSPGAAAGQPAISPPYYSRTFSQSTMYDPAAPYGPTTDELPSRYSRRSTFEPRLEFHHSSTEYLNPPRAAPSIKSNASRRSKFDNDFTADGCPSNRSFYQGGSHWLTITVWVLAIFSTVFSGIYLVIALRAPRWGTSVHTKGSLTASTANVLTQLFGKLIELSFATVFVTFLGQVLSRRAFSRESRGISIAEMFMRNWIMQPGSIITHWEAIKYAALTFLGAVSLTVAILAMLYTTAASALIAPVLQFGPWEQKLMLGLVKTSFANPEYLAMTCETPILISEWDEDYSATKVGQTCQTINNAAQSFHNYQQFMTRWADIRRTGNGTDDQKHRPMGYALYNQNVTVNGSWINIIDTKEVSKENNRIVNEVTLAMPHAGVYQAARDAKNKIMQPEDLDGIGVYNIKGSVPSPYINVLCSHVKEPEIKDMVYQTAVNSTLNSTDLPTAWTYRMNWGNWSQIKTPVDKIFGWDAGETRPAFYKLPTFHNTILNNTSLWGQKSIYLIGTGGPSMESTKRGEYLLCKATAGMTANCSTQYFAAENAGEMAAHCEDPDDPMAFFRGNASRTTTVSLDWMNVAITGFNALSLNNGVTDGSASNARLLMKLMLQKLELNPSLPSPAEALAVMGGSMLLMSSADSPFVEFWNYTNTKLDPGEYQSFNASIRAQQYTSGGAQPYQKGFIVVLFAVFMLNILILIYMVINRGLVTDYTEPPNLFSIAINSPPNNLMRGSCGAGPEAPQYGIKWGVEMEGEHLYITDKHSSIYPATSTGVRHESMLSFGALFGRKKWKQVPSQTEIELAPTAYTSTPTREEEDEVPDLHKMRTRESNISRMYSKIAKRKSVL